MDERLKKQMEFILEADKLKLIGRQTYLADGSRKENDAEHSFHLALMCALLSEYAAAEIDVMKTMTMVLIHDVVEIDAGDTYAYDDAGNATKAEREQQAARRLFGLLPSDQALKFQALWEEFEAAETAEAKFANTLDKVQPLLLNDASGGRSWREHGVQEAQVLARNEHTADGSAELWEYAEEIIKRHVAEGNLTEGNDN